MLLELIILAIGGSSTVSDIFLYTHTLSFIKVLFIQ